MDEPESNSSGKSRNFTHALIFILFLIVIILIGVGLYVRHSRNNKLTKQINQTQKKVENINNTSGESKKDMVNEEMNGVKDINKPIVRLALTKAYAEALRPNLTKSNQADLDVILLYINGNPKVLITQNPARTKEVTLAVNNLKTAVKNLKIAGVVTMQKINNLTYTQGELINLNGTISNVGDDKDLSGNVFTLTESKTGYIYYLEFNEADSQLIQDNMDGKEIAVTVKVTSKASEPLTFRVVKDPILIVASLSPKPTASEISPTPTTTQ